MAQYKPNEQFTPETMRRLGNLAKGIYNYYGNWFGTDMGDLLTGPQNIYNNPEDLERATNIVRKMQTGAYRNNPGIIYNDPLPTKSNPAYTDPRLIYKGDGYSVYGPRTFYFDGNYVPDLAEYYNLINRRNSFGRGTPHKNHAGTQLY